MGRVLFFILFALVSLNGGEVRIAAAANVGYAVEDLIKEYEKIDPGTKVRVTLGSSGKLAAQILHGAPYDIYLSANMSYPRRLYKEGAAATEPEIYAEGVLVLFSVKHLDVGKGMEVLKDRSVTTVAIANPKTAPYGTAAMEAIRRSAIYDEVKEKLVFGESVAQTLSYALKAADIGMVAKSALYGPRMSRYREGINWVEVDRELYSPIEQGAVLLKRAEGAKEAKSFYRFLFSESAKDIFRRYGYRTR